MEIESSIVCNDGVALAKEASEVGDNFWKCLSELEALQRDRNICTHPGRESLSALDE
jgi:hypothetical protein